MVILRFIIALVLLVVGAEALVRGASRLAALLHISPLVIGLTVVAFGTSSPELAVSIKAALSNQASLALANVVGSNIFNVLFILGLSALIAPLAVSQRLVRFDVPLMIALSAVVLALGLDGRIGRIEGLSLVTGLGLYLSFLTYESRREGRRGRDEHAEELGPEPRPTLGWLRDLGFVLGGLALLVLGSRALVDSAVAMARALEVSEEIIGLTIIAAGTSLPEVVTSVVASLRKEVDIAVGNVAGSNLFNLMGVLGLSSLVARNGMEVSTSIIAFDLPMMILVAFACLPIFFTGSRISRTEGALFLAYYGAYTLYLVLAAAHHAALPMFSTVMLYFAIPLTLVTLVIVATGELRRGRRKAP